MSEVHVKDGESLENALKRFKRSCAKSGVLAEVRKREHYESPSVKRRKKSEAARKTGKSSTKNIGPAPLGAGLLSYLTGPPQGRLYGFPASSMTFWAQSIRAAQ